jgi:hypothetical protein
MPEMLTKRKIMNRLRKERQEASLEYSLNMNECVEKMLSEDERREFLRWDYDRPPGVPTSAWPGFERHIGLPPWSKAKRSVRSPRLVSISEGRRSR